MTFVPPLALILCILAAGSSLDNPPAVRAQGAPVLPPGDPEQQFQTLLEGYYGAYSRKDIDAMAAAWHPDGPAASGRKAFLAEFGIRDVVFQGLRLSGVSAGPGGGSARAVIELQVTDRKSGGGHHERWVRETTFLPHQGTWRLWNEASAGMALAARLLSAPPDQLDELLSSEPELVSEDALAGLGAEATSLRTRGLPGAWRAIEVRLLVARKAGNEAVMANCLIDMGLQHQVGGRVREARAAFSEARPLVERTGTRGAIALVNMNLAAVDYLEANYAAALDGYRSALEMFEAEGDRAAAASTMHSIGNARYMLGEHEQALESYAASLKLSVEMGNRAATAAVNLAIALVHKDLGNYSEAAAAYGEAAKISDAIADLVGGARAYQGLGEIRRLEGDFGQALEALHASLARWEKTPDAPNQAAAVFAIGQVYAMQRSFGVAEDWYRRALKLDRSIAEEGGIARDLGGMAGVHVALGRPEEALPEYEESLQLREKQEDRAGAMWTLIHLAALHVSQQRPAEALNACERAVGFAERLGDRPGLSTAWALKASARLAADEPDAAVEAAARAAEIARQVGRHDVLAYVATVAGKAHARAGRTDDARPALEEAVEELHLVPVGPGSETFFDDRRAPYVALVELLASQGRPADAFTWLERGRQHLLAVMLGPEGAMVTRGLSAAERDEERRLLRAARAVEAKLEREASRARPDEERRSQLQAESASIAGQHEALRQRLFDAHPGLQALRAQVDPAGVLAASPLLRPGEIAVAFSVGESKLTVFVVTPPLPDDAKPAGLQVESFDVNVKAADLALLVSRFRGALVSRDEAAGALADELGKLLLHPAAAASSREKGDAILFKGHVWVVPDAFLWGLPFEALRLPSGRPLVQEASVSYLPSLASLALYDGMKGLSPRPRLLAAGGPVPGKGAEERLALQKPGLTLAGGDNGRDARAAEALFGPARSKVLAGQAATARGIAGGSPDGGVMYLAVPALLNDASPFYSSLVLSPDAGDQRGDGLFEAGALMGLDVAPGLAVFPAADTVHPRSTGEALTALSWSLLAAGTPTVVVSRWVPAPAAAPRADRLATAFFRALLQPPAAANARPSAAKALRSAARRMLAAPSTRHPADWARFMVIGR